MTRGLCILLVATSAHASPFVSLDRTTGATNAGTHLGLMIFEDGNSDGTPVSLEQPRLQLFGEYAFTPNAGILASSSLIWFRSHDENDDFGLGSSRIGGYGRVALAVGPGSLELAVRASFILPTESFVAREGYNEDVSVHGSLFPWLEERAIDADAFWLSGGTNIRYRHRAFVVQLDAFVDVPLNGKIYKDDMSRGNPLRAHVGLGGAWLTPPWRLGAEVMLSGYPFAEQLYGDLEADEPTLGGLTVSLARTLQPGREVIFWFSNALNPFLYEYWRALGAGYQMML